MTISSLKQPVHRFAALARTEGVLLRRNRIALLTAVALPVAMVFSLKAAPSVVHAGGSRAIGAILLTGLVAFALLLAVYYNLVPALVARREQLVLKRLRTGESTDAEILAGTAAPAIAIAWAQIAVATVAAVAVFGMDPPANAVLAGAALILGTAVFVLLAAVTTAVTRASGEATVGGFFYCIFIGIVMLTIRVSAWTLRIMWELDSSRAVHARLSVAEERLRFARDLHDVLGRNLSLIAVTSELAGQLARRGDQGAAEHMLEVRRVAHESLREMRAVVSGYRTADLDAECAGAQAVLRSAGVSCRIIGNAAGLPPDVQAALGWVVREGTTNVIRHSDATACTIEFRAADAPGMARTVTLSMDNDRAHCLETGAAGTGLLGLGERLAGLGGSISGQHQRSGHFRLEATLPASGAAAGPADSDQGDADGTSGASRTSRTATEPAP